MRFFSKNSPILKDNMSPGGSEGANFLIYFYYNHYLTELKILKSDFFKSYDVSNVTPLGKPVVKEFYIRLCPHK